MDWAIAISVVSLAVAASSFWHSRQSINVDTIVQHFTWVSSALLEYPKLRKYFYEPNHDPTQLDEDDYSRAESIAEMIADVMDLTMQMRLPLPVLKHPADWIVDWRKRMIGNSVAVRRWVLESEECYNDKLVEEIRAFEKTLTNAS